MTPDQFRLLQLRARAWLDYRDSGNVCDPWVIQWAETLIRHNTAQIDRVSPPVKEQDHE